MPVMYTFFEVSKYPTQPSLFSVFQHTNIIKRINGLSGYIRIDATSYVPPSLSDAKSGYISFIVIDDEETLNNMLMEVQTIFNENPIEAQEIREYIKYHEITFIEAFYSQISTTGPTFTDVINNS